MKLMKTFENKNRSHDLQSSKFYKTRLLEILGLKIMKDVTR